MAAELRWALAGGAALAALALSAAGVRISIRLARRAGVMDIPNARSSHTTPTPRMGGVPMVLAALLAFGFWSQSGEGLPAALHPVLLSLAYAAAMATLGFLDDLSSLSARFRFLVQVAGAGILLGVVGRHAGIPLAAGASVPVVLWLPLGAMGVVWILNLYNFMDGLDGLAA
jgi:Fuc2NAc and GlcNAc transferase